MFPDMNKETQQKVVDAVKTAVEFSAKS